MKQGKQIFWLLFGKQDRWYQGMTWLVRMHERDCDGRLVNAFCLVLGITLYNIKKERKLINQSNDKTDKITHSRHSNVSKRFNSPLKTTVSDKERKKRKNSFQLIRGSTCCVSWIFCAVISVWEQERNVKRNTSSRRREPVKTIIRFIILPASHKSKWFGLF